MSGAPTAVAIVPVRLGSRRLPRKAVLDAGGLPLFLHTWRQATRAERFATVYVATDSDEVDAAARAAGARVLRTSAQPRTGSERCAEAARELDGVDLVVDVQGDWPEVAPADLDALVECLASRVAPTATLAAPLTDRERAAQPNIVKVVRARDGDAMYFSRSPIPFDHGEDAAPVSALRHIGVYAFRIDTLLAIPDLPSSGLAETEGLEQLRFLENGIAMRVLDAHGDPWGIEDQHDFDRFVKRLAGRADDMGGNT